MNSKYYYYSRLGQQDTEDEKRDPRREKGYDPNIGEPIATEKNPMGMRFKPAPKIVKKKLLQSKKRIYHGWTLRKHS